MNLPLELRLRASPAVCRLQLVFHGLAALSLTQLGERGWLCAVLVGVLVVSLAVALWQQRALNNARLVLMPEGEVLLDIPAQPLPFAKQWPARQYSVQIHAAVDFGKVVWLRGKRRSARIGGGFYLMLPQDALPGSQWRWVRTWARHRVFRACAPSSDEPSF